MSRAGSVDQDALRLIWSSLVNTWLGYAGRSQRPQACKGRVGELQTSPWDERAGRGWQVEVVLEARTRSR